MFTLQLHYLRPEKKIQQSHVDVMVDYFRVGNSWKSQLVETKLFNQSIGFMDWRVERPAQVKMNKRFGRAAIWPWRSFFQLDLSELTHLVCIGNMTSAHYKKTRTVFAVKKPLKKITFWGCRLSDTEIIQAAVPLQGICTLLQIVQCDVRWDNSFYFCKFHDHANLPLEAFSWRMPLKIRHLVLDETFKQVEGQVEGEVERLGWLYKNYDSMDLIWPYGEDQVEWLNASLKLLASVKHDVLDAIRICGDAFLTW